MKKFVIPNTDNEEGRIETVSIDEFTQNCDLEVVNCKQDCISLSSICVNRPGLFLSGYEDYFAQSRVQVIGHAEMYYLQSLVEEERFTKLKRLFQLRIPCLILSRGHLATDKIIELSNLYDVPIFSSDKMTSEVITKIINYLSEILSPQISTHGTLVNINDIGVLIIGDSGVGKSETALELVHKGHRLISDDAVVLKKITNNIIGQPPNVINGFMEIRGVGIIDLDRIYGLSSLQSSKKIDLVIELENWKEGQEYDRVGRDLKTAEILGLKIPKIVIPVSSGRNLAIVIEAAASNFRLRKLGFIAADIIDSRIKDI